MYKQRKNPNDPARFVNKIAATKDGEKADIHYYLDLEKIAEEEKYDGLYAICTDLLDDDVADILKVSEGRWQIEDCFRTMKTEFDTRPVYVSREDRIKAHFLICFLALLHFRLLKWELKTPCTTEQLLEILKDIKFADVEDRGFIPVYERQQTTDELHENCGFRTDYQFITKRKMKEIQKKVNEDKTLLYFKYAAPSATAPVFSRIVALACSLNCQRRDYITKVIVFQLFR